MQLDNSGPDNETKIAFVLVMGEQNGFIFFSNIYRFSIVTYSNEIVAMKIKL